MTRSLIKKIAPLPYPILHEPLLIMSRCSLLVIMTRVHDQSINQVWCRQTTRAQFPAKCFCRLLVQGVLLLLLPACVACSRRRLPAVTGAVSSHTNAQHSRVLTTKSSPSTRATLPYVEHGCVRPWYRSPSSHNPNLPLQTYTVVSNSHRFEKHAKMLLNFIIEGKKIFVCIQAINGKQNNIRSSNWYHICYI